MSAITVVVTATVVLAIDYFLVLQYNIQYIYVTANVASVVSKVSTFHSTGTPRKYMPKNQYRTYSYVRY